MAEQTRERVGMSLADWERRWQDGPFELIDGEVIEVSPEVLQHMILTKLFLREFFKLEDAGVGQAFAEGTFAQLEGSDWVKGSRIPDVMFYLQARWKSYTANTSKTRPLVLYPDIVVEIVSPNDSYTVLNRKVRQYLADGVQLVWVVDPRTQTVDVWYKDGSQKQLTKADTLTDTLVPGFSLELSKVFDDEVL
jgi:Uma2 family endonuclease